MAQQNPRLRGGVKTNPLYPLNEFPTLLKKKLAENLVFHLATRGTSELEGKDWERIFADCIGANWSPSNLGLDDITHIASSTAWGAKTVKGKVYTKAQASTRNQTVRLISGRNSVAFSYGEYIDPGSTDVQQLGGMVLEIWNTRVREVRARFSNLRTVVLLKGEDLLSVAVFEVDTLLYLADDYRWEWNAKDNLEGFGRDGLKKFTWQPHGSQFTIVEEVPVNALRLRIRQPNRLKKEDVLNQLSFDSSYYSEI